MKEFDIDKAIKIEEIIHGDVKSKFMGVLKGFELSELNDATVKLLIENNIVKKDTEKQCFIDHDDKGLEFPFYYNSSLFRLNNELLDEIFYLLYDYIEKRFSRPMEYDSYQNDKDKFYLKFNSLLGKKDKIKFLKKQFRKQIPKTQRFSSYSSLVKVYGDSQFTSWEYSIKELVEIETIFLRLYLTIETNKNPAWVVNDLVKSCIENEEESIWKEQLDLWMGFYKKDLFLKKILSEIEELNQSENNLVLGKSNSTNLKVNKEITLKNLFMNPNNYDKVISDLKQNTIINDNNEIIIPEKYTKRGDKAFMCSIILQLDDNGFLKTCDDTDKVIALNNTFNVNVSKQNYNSFLNSKYQHNYLKITSFLKKTIKFSIA